MTSVPNSQVVDSRGSAGSARRWILIVCTCLQQWHASKSVAGRTWPAEQSRRSKTGSCRRCYRRFEAPAQSPMLICAHAQACLRIHVHTVPCIATQSVSYLKCGCDRRDEADRCTCTIVQHRVATKATAAHKRTLGLGIATSMCGAKGRE